MQQGTKEWLELRMNRIGASDASTIMGMNPWKTPYQLWEEKLGIRPPQEVTERMQRGLDLEPEARLKFFQLTGIEVQPSIMFHPTIKFMMASLDGIDVEKKNIVEIKCPGNGDHKTAKSGKVPEKYYPQLQHQIEVCGLKKAFYLSYDGKEAILIEVYRDNNFIKIMLEKEKSFWECMESFIPPKDNEPANDVPF